MMHRVFYRSNAGDVPHYTSRVRRGDFPYEPKMGDRVTCNYPVSAYGSGRNGNPSSAFKPGMVGTVGAVDVPSVYAPCIIWLIPRVGNKIELGKVYFQINGAQDHTWYYEQKVYPFGRDSTFTCVDYEDETGRVWRVDLYYDNIRPAVED